MLDDLSYEQLQKLKAIKENHAQEIEPPKKKGSSVPASVLEGLMNSLTLGFAPKIKGGIAAAVAKQIYPELRDKPFGEVYQKARDYARQQQIAAFNDNPVSYTGGQLAGAFGLPFSGASLGKAALSGAGYGAAQSVGETDEGSLQDRAMTAALGGVTGAGAGGLGYKLINFINPGRIPSKAASERLELAKKSGVPLSEGELLLDPVKIAKEEAANQGLYGEKAARDAAEFKRGQREAFGDYSKRVELDASQGVPFNEKGESSARAISELQQKMSNERQPIKQAFQEAMDSDASITANNLLSFPLAIRKQFEKNWFNKKLSPLAFTELDALEGVIKKAAKQSESIPFRDIEMWRQGLNQTMNSADRKGKDFAALTQLKSASDDFISNIVDKELIQGDPKILDKLKTARQLRAVWGKKYQARNRKEVGKKFLEDIYENSVDSSTPYTNEQIANKIFGVSKIGFDKNAGIIVKELKTHLSPEQFNDIRVDAIRRIMNPLYEAGDGHGRRFINNFNSIKKEHPTLLKALLEPEQHKEFNELGKVWHSTFGEAIPSKSQRSKTSFFNKLFDKFRTSVPFMKSIGAPNFDASMSKAEGLINKGLPQERAINDSEKAIVRTLTPAFGNPAREQEEETIEEPNPDNYLDHLTIDQLRKLQAIKQNNN